MAKTTSSEALSICVCVGVCVCGCVHSWCYICLSFFRTAFSWMFEEICECLWSFTKKNIHLMLIVHFKFIFLCQYFFRWLLQMLQCFDVHHHQTPSNTFPIFFQFPMPEIPYATSYSKLIFFTSILEFIKILKRVLEVKWLQSSWRFVLRLFFFIWYNVFGKRWTKIDSGIGLWQIGVEVYRLVLQ